jgi:RNA polymerase sigma-70 factor (ECF subfamily)
VADLDPNLSAAISGDRHAREQLLLEHYDRLNFRIQKKLTGKLAETHSSEDVLQEALVLAIRDFGKCRATNQSELGAWLNSVVDNRMRDIRKRLYTQKRGGAQNQAALPPTAQSSMHNLLDVLEGGGASPSSRVARHDAVKALQVGIASLPPEQREAIERRFLEGHSLDGVAGQMKKTPAAVRALIHRAKKALRDSMGQSSRWFNKK